MTLSDLRAFVDRYAAGTMTLAELQAALVPVLAGDPLDVEESDGTPWERNADEARLFWRIVYLAESEPGDGDRFRGLAPRIFRCLDATGSAADAVELLPLLADQDRLRVIVAKHLAGVISRTGFLSVLTESGYPGHVKLWLEHAGTAALARLVALLDAGEYDAVARMVERPPA